MEETTVFKMVNKFDNYLISNKGDVYSLISNKELKRTPNNSGYLTVRLYDRTTGQTFLIHKLVFEHFSIEPIDKNLDVDHIDGIKSNCSIWNLQQLSHSANCSKYWKSKKENKTNE